MRRVEVDVFAAAQLKDSDRVWASKRGDRPPDPDEGHHEPPQSQALYERVSELNRTVIELREKSRG
jgi:hypothetical protein